MLDLNWNTSDIKQSVILTKRGLMVIDYYLSRRQKEGELLCAFLADVLHNLPLLPFDNRDNKKRYWKWINKLCSGSDSAEQIIMIYIFKNNSGLYLRRVQPYYGDAPGLHLPPIDLFNGVRDEPFRPPDLPTLKELLSIIHRAIVAIRNTCYHSLRPYESDDVDSQSKNLMSTDQQTPRRTTVTHDETIAYLQLVIKTAMEAIGLIQDYSLVNDNRFHANILPEANRLPEIYKLSLLYIAGVQN